MELCASSPVFGQSSSLRSAVQRRCSFTITKPDFDGEISPDLSPISSPEKPKSGLRHKGRGSFHSVKVKLYLNRASILLHQKLRSCLFVII